MELSRRDFMRNTAAFAAVASVLGTSGIAFAADADQNCLVKVDSPDRQSWPSVLRRAVLPGWSTTPTIPAVTPRP